MGNNINPVNNNNIKPIDSNRSIPSVGQGLRPGGFQEILKAKIKPTVQFSGHALRRLQQRNITLTPDSLEKLSNAVQMAGEKGCRESLVLMDNLALIVSIKNNTVITAIDGDSIKKNVFTNIDSAMVIG